jgi:hypothetical protein
MHRALAPLFLLVACGSDPIDDGTTDDGSGGTGGSGGSAGTSSCRDGPATSDVCSDGPGYVETTDPIAIGSVSATIVDENGEPIADLAAFVCGTKICSLPVRTNAAGYVTIAFSDSIEKPAFKYGDGFEVGRFFPLLSEDAGDIALGTIGTPRLPLEGACLSPGTTAESGNVRLSLAPDAMIELLPLDYPEPHQRTFRAAELPLSLAPSALYAGEGFGAIFALAPVGAVICPAATIDLPNTPLYGAGTEVEILVHGADVEEEWAPYGLWRVVATGRVDETGERIETIDGGLPVISDVAVRAR